MHLHWTTTRACYSAANPFLSNASVPSYAKRLLSAQMKAARTDALLAEVLVRWNALSHATSTMCQACERGRAPTSAKRWRTVPELNPCANTLPRSLWTYAELMHHTKIIAVAPMLDDAAIDNPQDVDTGCLHSRACRWDPKQLALMCPTATKPFDHPITLN